MKIIILTISLSLPFLLQGQIKCYDYACNMDRAQKAFTNGLYKEAIDYCRAAKTFPNSNATEADAMVFKILETITAQQNAAENEKQNATKAQVKALEDEKSALAAIKNADAELIASRREKEAAEAAIRRAESEEKRAVEAIKKAEMDIENARKEKEKAAFIIKQADGNEKKAIDLKKQSETAAETARRNRQKADETIYRADKIAQDAAGFVKETSNTLNGKEEKKETPQTPPAPKEEKKETSQYLIVSPGAGTQVASRTVSLSDKRTEIRKLQRAIDQQEDKNKVFYLQTTLIDSLEKWYKVDTSYRNDLSESYANKAWNALFLKKFTDAEQASRSGLAVDGNKRFINAILGHALLFQGYYDQAMGVYRSYLAEPKQYRSKSNLDSLIEDLDVLKDKGVNHKDMARARAILLSERRR